MNDKYILDGHEVVLCEDLMKWASLFENADRRVAKDIIGGVEVSTVFLGLNHNYGEGEPILFETLVFGGPLDGEMERYSTWDEAKAGHAAMVERVKAIPIWHKWKKAAKAMLAKIDRLYERLYGSKR